MILGFLFYAAGVGFALPVAPTVRNLILRLNLLVILTYAGLIYYDFVRPRKWLSITRDWAPLSLILLAYREMGWLALPHGGHASEAHWIVWDRAILGGGARAAIEVLGPVLPSVLEIAYALVYALAPFSIAILYLHGRRNQVDRFLFVFSVGVLLCYAQFPFWPSDPPRAVFVGEDLPSYNTLFRQFNLWMLGNYGIHTSVFPSAHVAGAFAAAFGMRRAAPKVRWVSRFLFVMAVLIAVATVYGRYHYVADATAGFAVAAFAVALHRRRANRNLGTRLKVVTSLAVD